MNKQKLDSGKLTLEKIKYNNIHLPLLQVREILHCFPKKVENWFIVVYYLHTFLDYDAFRKASEVQMKLEWVGFSENNDVQRADNPSESQEKLEGWISMAFQPSAASSINEVKNSQTNHQWSSEKPPGRAELSLKPGFMLMHSVVLLTKKIIWSVHIYKSLIERNGK